MTKGLALVLLALAAGCGGPGGSAPAPRDNLAGGTLSLALAINPATFDPVYSQEVELNGVLQNVYEGLVGWDEKNQLVPVLAEKWEVLDGGRRYRFHLRKGVKFHNGAAFSSADVKWSIERSCSPGVTSSLPALYLGDIIGAKEKIAGKGKEVTGAKVVDAQTIDLVIDQPRPYFLGKLSYPVGYILPANSVPEGGIIKDADNCIGTGPFTLSDYESQQEVDLKRFDGYWGGAPKLAHVSYQILKDPATRVNLFRLGKLHVSSLAQQDIPGFQKDPVFAKSLIYSDRPAVHYVGMNGNIYKPFADPRVRRAFAMAVDRERIVREVLHGVGHPADGVLPPSVMQQRRVKKPIPFDPAGARALLKQAGWEKLPPIELVTSDQNRDRKTICESIIGQLTENLGVPATLRIMDSSAIIKKATARELGFFYGNWFADYLDPENFLSLLLSEYGQNRTDWHNPHFTALCRGADVELNGAKRMQMYAQAEDLVAAECPWIPLYFPQEVLAVQPQVKGLRQNVFGTLPYTQVSLEP